MIIAGLFQRHSRYCSLTDCACNGLIEKYRGEFDETLHENRRSYLSKADLPASLQDSFIFKAIKILVGDVALKFSKNAEFALLMAEIEFYYYANYYNSLKQLHAIESEHSNIYLMQRVYCLRRAIIIGFKDNAEIEKESEGILASIEYLRLFRKFLEKIEETYELNQKFWNSLLEPLPNSEKVNAIGKSLCLLKFSILGLSHTIWDISSNHFEFLLRFGLFMRFIMQDKSAFEQIFQKLASLYSNAIIFT